MDNYPDIVSVVIVVVAFIVGFSIVSFIIKKLQGPRASATRKNHEDLKEQKYQEWEEDDRRRQKEKNTPT